MAKNNRDGLLCALLDCGYLDLSILDDTDESFILEAVERLQDEGIRLSLNGITDEMFCMAQSEIRDALEERRSDLEHWKLMDTTSPKEMEELEALNELDPEEDIGWFCNCLDTSIYIAADYEEVYRKYFGELLDDLEEKMGFAFQ